MNIATLLFDLAQVLIALAFQYEGAGLWAQLIEFIMQVAS